MKQSRSADIDIEKSIIVGIKIETPNKVPVYSSFVPTEKITLAKVTHAINAKAHTKALTNILIDILFITSPRGIIH